MELLTEARSFLESVLYKQERKAHSRLVVSSAILFFIEQENTIMSVKLLIL